MFFSFRPFATVSVKKISIFLLFLIISVTAFSQPIVNLFSPASAPAGTPVTITGSGFSSTPGNNIVFFGAVRASVTAASATSLTVTVPSAATYQPISVTVNNLTGYSKTPFILTLKASANITVNSFQSPAYIEPFLSGSISPDSYTAKDFDGDGKPDIAEIFGPENQLFVLKNASTNGTVLFTNEIGFTTGARPVAISSADLNGDGRPDLVVVNLNDSTLSLYQNTSTPGQISFSTLSRIHTGGWANTVAIGDFDGDGRADIAITVTSGLFSTVAIFKNTSTATNINIQKVLSFEIPDDTSPGLTAADINGDGKPDLISCDYIAGAISIFKNTGGGGNFSFASQQNLPTVANPTSLTVGDLDGDGQADIAVGSGLTPYFGVFHNSSSGGTISFAKNQIFSTANATTSITMGDLNGDGQPDIVASELGSNFQVFQNKSTPASLSFQGSNYSVNGASPVTIADFDGDGSPDIASGSGYKAFILLNKVIAPLITSFSPVNGGVSSIVDIYGTNFTGATSVTFGGVQASSFSIAAGQIVATLAHGASGNVIVTTPYGTAVDTGFHFFTPPVLKSFTPNNVGAGVTVTISGSALTTTSSVSFGGVAASSFTVLSDSVVTALVGTGASGNLVLQTPFGTASLPGVTFFQPPAITSFTPGVGPAGTIVKIKGTNFTGTTNVYFGDKSAASFNVLSDTVINAVTGISETGQISVVTPGGTSVSQPVFYCKPVIDSISPDSGSQATTVYFYGHNFTGATAVTIGGDPENFTVIADSIIKTLVWEDTTNIITVTAPGGTAIFNNFRFLSPPVIKSVSPSRAAPGTLITINGRYFTGTNKLSFNYPVSFNTISDSVITAVVPSEPNGFTSIEITNRIGTGYTNIIITPSPYIYSISPATGPVGSKVVINGTNFNTTADSNIVYFGTVRAKVLSATNLSLTVQVPAGSQFTKISVLNTAVNLTAFSTQYFSVTFNKGPLTSTSFSGKTVLTPGNAPSAVATGDLDGDGKPDIVVPNFLSGTFSVYLNESTTGKVIFASKVDYPLNFAYQVFLKDMDGDGKLDILVLHAGNSSMNLPNGLSDTLVIYRNISTTGHLAFAPGYNVRILDVGLTIIGIDDYDYDGRPDIALIGQTEDEVTIVSNISTVNNLNLWANFYYAPGMPYPEFINYDDVDGDSYPDITLPSYGFAIYSKTDLLHLSAVNPVFPFYEGTLNGAEGLGGVYGDMDGDGKLDFVLEYVTTNSEGFAVYQNTTSAVGKIQFNLPVYFNNPATPETINNGSYYGGILSDLDGDGKPDIIAIRGGDDSMVTVIKNTSTLGNPSLNQSFLYPAGSKEPFYVASCDIDGDGAPDIILCDEQNNVVTILLNDITSALPVTILNFTGNLNKNQTVLNWQTASEINTTYFTVERSTDGISFSAIGNVKAHGNSNISNSYSFVDASLPNTGSQLQPLYYRLRIVDADGNTSYSNTVVVDLAGSKNGIIVFPNPATNNITIQLPSTQNSSVVRIMDANGKLVKTIQVDKNQQELNVNVSSFAPGVYYLQWQGSNQTQAIKIMVK